MESRRTVGHIDRGLNAADRLILHVPRITYISPSQSRMYKDMCEEIKTLGTSERWWNQDATLGILTKD